MYPNPPLPIPDVFRELATLLDVVSARSAPYADEEDEVVVVAPPLVTPLTLPLVTPRPVPLVDEDGAVPAALRLSSSSAFLRASSRRRSASAARLSASWCFCSVSVSMSTRSWVEPFQSGLRISRWLCSVCERMRVHVLSSVEALSTVLDTVYVSSQLYPISHHPSPNVLTYAHVALGPLQRPNDPLNHLIDLPNALQLLEQRCFAGLIGIESGVGVGSRLGSTGGGGGWCGERVLFVVRAIKLVGHDGLAMVWAVVALVVVLAVAGSSGSALCTAAVVVMTLLC